MNNIKELKVYFASPWFNPEQAEREERVKNRLRELGFKGTRLNKKYAASAPIATSQNAIPYLAYWDIFKNYFANKQEENFYYVGVGETVRDYTITLNDGKHEVGNGETTRALISATTSIQGNGIIPDWTKFWENCIITLEQTTNGNKEFTGAELATTTDTATIILDKLQDGLS